MLISERLNKKGQILKIWGPILHPFHHMPISFQTKNKDQQAMKTLIKPLMAYSATIPIQTENSHGTIPTFDR
jgi:hypothetical protein